MWRTMKEEAVVWRSCRDGQVVSGLWQSYGDERAVFEELWEWCMRSVVMVSRWWGLERRCGE